MNEYKMIWIAVLSFMLCGMAIAEKTASAEDAPPPVRVGFSRGEPSAKDIVLQAIAEARVSIYMAAYQFTQDDIVEALLGAQKRGVKVAVVLDKTQAQGAAQAELVRSGIGCAIDHRHKIMHHKFIVIDMTSVETGSFNYSESADKANAENAIYIRDSPDIAAKYKAQWEDVNRQALPCEGGGTVT